MTSTSTRRHRPCPVCEVNEAVALYFNEMASIGELDMSYQVSSCGGCGFVYASELPASAVYDAYYRGLSKYDVMTSTAEVRPVDRVRMSVAVDLCRPYLAADALVADIGCGTGALLNAFAEAGWSRLHGIDPAPGASAKADSLFGLKNIRTGTLSQARESLPLDQVSLVCLTGVLEHLSDLRGDLTSLVEGLNKNAMILVEVPALERFVRKPLEPYGEFSLEHIQFFSAESLGRLMADLGYQYSACQIVALSGGVTDSLFGLFTRKDMHKDDILSGSIDPTADPIGYIDLSKQVLSQVLEKIIQCSARQLVIYGAGSHSARLLPMLDAMGAGGRILGIVDSNPNLLDQYVGRYQVQLPADLVKWPDATIVISSFAAQDAIASFIVRQFPNPILRLYP
jgi:SAM-dependent methyltransferase